MYKTRQYRIWAGMIARCYNPKEQAFPWYGARGIKVCEKWRTFLGFWSDMQEGFFDRASLDRIDNDKGYYKGNCRWVTLASQGRNKRNVRMFLYQGTYWTIPDLARLAGVHKTTMFSRLVRMKWSMERALTLPASFGNRYRT